MYVLITQNRKKGEFRHGDLLEENYHKYFSTFGITLIPIPNDVKLVEKYFNLPVSGIIISGGEDISPSLYGGDSEGSKNYTLERDNTERKLLEIAISKKIPVLLICRGLQLLNVHFNGGLNQKIDGHVGVNHAIKIIDERLMESLGGDFYNVNSFHGQGLDENLLSSQLKPFAVSNDGLIEGIYHPLLPIAGVQWHPERESPNHKINKLLIEAFVNRKLFWEK